MSASPSRKWEGLFRVHFLLAKERSRPLLGAFGGLRDEEEAKRETDVESIILIKTQCVRAH